MKINYKIFRSRENYVLGNYQLAYIAQDLFGDWNIVKAHGKVGRKKTKLTSIPFRSREEAVKTFIS